MKIVLSLFFLILFLSFTSAQTTVDYYYGLTCPHCINVADSGVLERINQTVQVTKYETWNDVKNADKFSALVNQLNVPKEERGVPFLLVNCSGKVTYLVGDTPIIQNAENYAKTCNFEGKTMSSVNYTLIWLLVGILAVVAGAYLLFKKR